MYLILKQCVFHVYLKSMGKIKFTAVLLILSFGGLYLDFFFGKLRSLSCTMV